MSGATHGSGPLAVVATLTDEEIDVLCDGAHQVVVLPHLSMLDEPEARVARRVAERSLGARGLLSPLSEDERGAAAKECGGPWEAGDDESSSGSAADDDLGLTVAVHELLAPVLQMRRGAPVVVVLHRTPTADLTTFEAGQGLTRYLFVHEGTCVCEDVTALGVHTLSVGLVEHLAEVVAQFLVPPTSCEVIGAQTVVADPTDLPRALQQLGLPLVLAEAVVLHPWQGMDTAKARLLTLGPGGCYHADLGVGSRWVCRPAHPDDLVGLVVDEVAAAQARVTAEVDGHNGERD